MNNHLGLSDMEFDLMSFFWEQTSPVTFAQILDFCNDVKGWNWAKTTAHTYITRLLHKNLLGMNSTKGMRRTYFAKISREAFMSSSVQELVDVSFSGSIKNLLLSLIPNNRLTRKDVEELHKILDQLAEPDDTSEN